MGNIPNNKKRGFIMKNRIISCVLAVLMVVSMMTVLAVSSSAEVAGLKVVVGNAYGVAGETAMVDIYVVASDLGDYLKLRDWQFVFDGAKVTGTGNAYVTSDNDPKAFANTTTNTVGCSTNNGQYVIDKFAALAVGGSKIATIAFDVPAEANADIELTISEVTSLTFETAESGNNEAAKAEVVAGKIIPVDSLESNAPAYAGTGADYTIPSFYEGARVTKIAKGGKLSGTFGNVNVPATIASVAAAGLTGTYASFNVKNANLDKASLGALVEKVAEDGVIFYTKRADGTDTAFASLTDYIENDSTNEPEIANVLAQQIVVKENTITVLATIAAPDDEFNSIRLVVTNENGKVYEMTTKAVAGTVEGVASTSFETAEAQGITPVSGAYLAGLKLTNVPEAYHTLTVTVYATTLDGNGNEIVVCSDTQTFKNIAVV